MRVMLGGCTCSTAASSPRVIGPEPLDGGRARPGVDAVSSSPVVGGLLADAAGEPGHRQAELRRQLPDLGEVGVGRRRSARGVTARSLA